MKGLRLYLPPFAPDTSGAASVFYPAGGMVIIIDAGGCAGNICAFDEPRWQSESNTSAVFSAGLRDMDAIMGRDDRLLQKIRLASQEIPVRFAALISTPVPAIIGTDLRALQRMGEHQLKLPVLTVNSDGTRLYDEGEEKAWLALFERFTSPCNATIPQSIGVLGFTPMDFSRLDGQNIRRLLMEQGANQVLIYGTENGLHDYESAAAMERNLVVSPAGLAAARYLEKTFQIPYTIGNPLMPDWLASQGESAASTLAAGHRVLIIHQQITANALRETIRTAYPQLKITCATWFQQHTSLQLTGDQRFHEEDDLIAAVTSLAPDVIIADPLFARALQNYTGRWLPFPHFAVSGGSR